MFSSTGTALPRHQYLSPYGVSSIYSRPPSFVYDGLPTLRAPLSHHTRSSNGQINHSEEIEDSRMPIPLPFSGMRVQPRTSSFGKESSRAARSGASTSVQPRSSSVQVSLNDQETWKSFDVIGNEMIVTKPGRYSYFHISEHV